MRMHSRPREGFALATSIVAIVLIGLLIAGTFFGSTQEFRAGRNSLYQERALAAAEFGQAEVLTNWSSPAAMAMKPGEVATRTLTVQAGATADVKVTKLNMLTFAVVSEGRAADGTAMAARRRTGMLIRLDIPDLRIVGALTTAGRTNATGTGSLSGSDVNPAGWACDATGPAKAGIVNDDAADVTSSGACSGFSCVTGSPKVAQDPLAGDPDTYDEFGGISYDSLAALADVVITVSGTTPLSGIGPVVAGGSCNTSDTRNWGDVNRNTTTPGPCETYFPIIHVQGTGMLELQSGKGQGILLVDDDLMMKGNFEFYGPIIVKGSFNSEGTGNKVVGGVMAKNEGCTASTCNEVKGNAHIQFSRCSLLATLIPRATPVLASRSWADLF